MKLSTSRSRAVRILVNVLLVPLWALIAFISINAFENYSEVGDLTLLALMLLFAAWSWWYAEDRDRRRAVKRSGIVGDGDAARAVDGDAARAVDDDGYSLDDGHSPSAT